VTTATNTTAANTLPSPAAPAHGRDEAPNAIAAAAPEKPKRTLGLKIFDNLLYTFFMNPVVFVASVLMTYMTLHGKSFGKEGTWVRGVGEWFQSRSKPVANFFGYIGVKSEKTRKEFASVAFSFIDGTLFSLMAKPLEDRREKIAKRIDDALGTSPTNMRAYDAEPKQSWRSVLEGRTLTSLIVVPTAYLLSRWGGNQRAFLDPGFAVAEKIATRAPKLNSWLEAGTINTSQKKGDFIGTVFFEAFYTSVCTAGLYVISRMVARKHPKKQETILFDVSPKTNATFAEENQESPKDSPLNKVYDVSKKSRINLSKGTKEFTL
jgi:hypothetical protein